MGISIGGIVDGIRHTADKVIDRGEEFAGHIASGVKDKVEGAGKSVLHKAEDVGDGIINKALPIFNKVADKVLPDGVANVGLGAVEKTIDLGVSVLDHVPGVPQNIKDYAHEIGDVNFQGFVDTSGTTADWGRLYGDWFFERKPESFGTWDTTTVDGQTYDRVHVTDMSYAHDLARTDNQKGITQYFLGQHPQVGDQMSFQWQYTAPGTVEGGTPYGLEMKDGKPVFVEDASKPGGGYYITQGGHYGIIESFIGSNDTTVKCVDVDPATGNVTLQYTVTNDSHFESGTRLPGSLQDHGAPEHVIDDQPRGTGIHVGGNFQQVYTWEQTFDANGNPVGDVRPVTDHAARPDDTGGETDPANPGSTDQPGQTTENPGNNPSPPEKATGRTDPALEAKGYKPIIVKPGDTIWDLAKANNIPFETALALNRGHISNPDLIYPGDAIYLKIDTPPAPPQHHGSARAE
jgi:LysM repeat protein